MKALGLVASRGRLFGDGDMPHLGAPGVAVLTHEFWQSDLAGDPAAIGSTLSLDGEDHVVIGILPSNAVIPQERGARIWIPLPWDPATEQYRDWRGFGTAARLAPGRGVEEAQAELDVIQSSLAAAYPDAVEGWGVTVRPMHEQVVGSARPMLMMLLAAVGVVLLIVCANMAGLMIARASTRHRELVVRSALGAGRRRLAQQLLTESALLALLGGIVGAVVAAWGTRALVALAPPGIPRIDEVAMDLRVLGFAFATTAIAGIVFGLAPAIRAGRLDLADVLHQGRSRAATRDASRMRRTLVVAQLALGLVLMAGAGLLLKSFAGLLDWEPGFETEHVLTFQVFPPQDSYENDAEFLALYREMERRLTALPGVRFAGTTPAGPLFGGGDGAAPFLIEARPDQDPANTPSVLWYDVGPGYFETLGLPLLDGRALAEEDGPGAPLVAVINQAMARRFWPESSPVGATVTLPDLEATVRVVGVVGDVKPFLPGASPEPELYFSNRQKTRGAAYFALRTEIDPAQLTGPVTDIVQGIDPDMVPIRLEPLTELIDAQLVRPRFNMLLVGLFALVSLVLGAVGIYGLIAYTVEVRRHEIGIRMALGAERERVLGWVLREGMVLVSIGIGLGVVAALGFTRLLSGMLYGVSPGDPLALAGTALVLAAVGLAACAAPAVRASRLDPLLVLRRE